jgi:ribosomal protein S6--L-glutamate ligase
MKLGILSRAPHAYSTQRLKAAALERGHEARVLNTLRFAIDLSAGEPDLQYRGKPLSHYDAVLPRIGASITYFGLAVVRQFEQMDVYTPNTSNGIANSRDKLRAIQILSRHDIGIPATTFARDRADVLPAIERVGGAPVVIKLLEGTQGIGVILAPDDKVAEAVIETLQSTKQNVLIQRFIAESRGNDIRALVVGDRVVAAMRRRAQGDEFRSNVHRGGMTEIVELDEESRRVAVRAAQIMGLRVAGVDLLESDQGPLVMEVNSSPGLEGIETATELDVAGAIIDYIANQVSFPELDVRERLSVSTGYGVAELVVREGADILGKTLGESGLRERDITVLTLRRGTTVIPIPRGDRVLEVNDGLLCFGKLEEMRSLVPERRRRRARPKVQPLPEPPIPDPGMPTAATGGRTTPMPDQPNTMTTADEPPEDVGSRGTEAVER